MSGPAYPDTLEIRPLERPPDATCPVPGSKSITNRALVLAALASRSGGCTLTGALASEDTEVMVESLTRLGFRVAADWPNESVTVSRNTSGRLVPNPAAELYVANSGTTMRFLTALVSVGHGVYRLDGVPRMRERPIQDLLDALGQLGVDARSDAGNGCPPVTVAANGWGRAAAIIRGDVSSQFLSGLMMAAPFAGPPAVEVAYNDTLVSRPYLDMTERVLADWGVPIGFKDRSRSFAIPGRPDAHRAEYHVEPDASAASYFWGAAAVTGGRVTVPGLGRDGLQGDVRFVDVLARMGCGVEFTADGVTVAGGPLRGVDVDMNDISDTVMTLGAVACFADGPTTVRNVGHVRHKETDRLAALAAELRRLGAGVDESADGLTIAPRPLTGAAVETYNDHRMAMSLALVGLRVPGVVVKNPACVAKTYPRFFEDLERLR